MSVTITPGHPKIVACLTIHRIQNKTTKFIADEYKLQTPVRFEKKKKIYMQK